MSEIKLINNDCIEAMKAMEDNSIDSIVTDPPYELGFMGKSWDSTGIAFNVAVWTEALRVLKPGGHLIAFSGSRTYHRMAVAIEDAGFEIRDQIMWVYGSGFPKSMDISKALDKQEGIWRGRAGAPLEDDDKRSFGQHYERNPKEPPYTDAAKQWQGWGTALKPAHEPMVLARKPVVGTVANNVLTYGVGGLNIDASRVEGEVPSVPMAEWTRSGTTGASDQRNGEMSQPHSAGRWPANFIHDGLETEWAKFFYCAKTSKRDRNEGLDGFEEKFSPTMGDGIGAKEHNPETAAKKAKHHPTVKPTSLMQYLVRLVTPEGGTVLDPFMGSGSTGKACAYEGFDFIGIDQSAEYVEIARARIAFAQNESADQDQA
jgi:site-specific DNA-methyltransferase (adenine-specific)